MRVGGEVVWLFGLVGWAWRGAPLLGRGGVRGGQGEHVVGGGAAFVRAEEEARLGLDGGVEVL